MNSGTTGYVDLEDGRMYYEAAGQGRALVMCHAGFADSRMWDEQWGEFTQRYRAIRYDMRGFGKSGALNARVSRRGELYRLLKQLGVEKAAFLGVSLGGETIIDLALEHPEIVSALVVVSAVPGGFEFQGEPPQTFMEMLGAVQQGDLARASELQNRIWVEGPFREPGQADPALRQRVTEMNRVALENGAWGPFSTQPLNPLDPPAAGRLAEIKEPTLVVAGALDDPEILRAAEVMAAAIPGAKKLIIPGCAHLPSMEKPAEFNRAVVDFLHTTG
jgi:pimeloyl-ACP methyl ester carboxylesterase